MSRWTDQFNAHPFRANWDALKSALKESRLEENSNAQTFEELARLKKVVAYIDGMLDALDPELVPLSKWDEFNPQASACASEINNFNSNRNVGHLQQANAYADNLIINVKPFVMTSGRSAKALSAAATSYSETLTKYFDIFKKNAADALAEVRASKDKVLENQAVILIAFEAIAKARSELLGTQEEPGGSYKEIQERMVDIEDSHEKISELYNELLIGDEDNDSRKSKIESAAKTIAAESEKAKALTSKTEQTVAGLEAFYVKVFGALNEDGTRAGGYEADLAGHRDKLNQFEEQQKTRYSALNTQIESLLPGATSAGLASAYREMKNSFQRPIKFSGGVFYVAIAILVTGSIMLAMDTFSWSDGIVFTKLGDWQAVLRSFAYKLPFYGPVVWLAYYASKRRSEYQRLQQEYAHKEALAKSYDSYKKQISELGLSDNEMLISLMAKAIDAISHNASQTLDGKHGDKMPLQDALEKVAEAVASLKAKT